MTPANRQRTEAQITLKNKQITQHCIEQQNQKPLVSERQSFKPDEQYWQSGNTAQGNRTTKKHEKAVTLSFYYKPFHFLPPGRPAPSASPPAPSRLGAARWPLSRAPPRPPRGLAPGAPRAPARAGPFEHPAHTPRGMKGRNNLKFVCLLALVVGVDGYFADPASLSKDSICVWAGQDCTLEQRKQQRSNTTTDLCASLTQSRRHCRGLFFPLHPPPLRRLQGFHRRLFYFPGQNTRPSTWGVRREKEKTALKDMRFAFLIQVPYVLHRMVKVIPSEEAIFSMICVVCLVLLASLPAYGAVIRWLLYAPQLFLLLLSYPPGPPLGSAHPQQQGGYLLLTLTHLASTDTYEGAREGEQGCRVNTCGRERLQQTQLWRSTFRGDLSWIMKTEQTLKTFQPRRLHLTHLLTTTDTNNAAAAAPLPPHKSPCQPDRRTISPVATHLFCRHSERHGR